MDNKPDKDTEQGFKLDLEDGKYTVVLHENGRLEALRHGEPWRELSGDNLVYWLAVELLSARKALRSCLERLEKRSV